MDTPLRGPGRHRRPRPPRLDQRGIILPLTLILVAVLAGLVAALLFLGMTEPTIAANLRWAAQARFAAEAGIERAFGQMATASAAYYTATTNSYSTPTSFFNTYLASPNLYTNIDPATNATAASSNVAAYTVTVLDNNDGDGSATTDSDSTVVIQSVGTAAGGSTRTLQAIVTTALFVRDAIVSNDSLDMSGNFSVQGTYGGVHSNANLSVGGSVSISMSATATGSYETNGSPTIGGQTGGSQPPHPIPDLQPANFASLANYVLTSTGTATDGAGHAIAIPAGWSWSHGHGWSCCGGANGTDGTYYIQDVVAISGSPNTPASPWHATIIGTSTISVAGNPSMAPAIDPSTGQPRSIQFLAGGDIRMRGSGGNGNVDSGCSTCWGGLIYTREQVDIAGNDPIRGAIMALSATDNDNTVRAGRSSVTGNASVTLNGPLRLRGMSGPLRIVSYTSLSQ